MTVNELIKWCEDNNVSLDTSLTIRAKDDYWIVPEAVYVDQPYFGNSREGEKWLQANTPTIDGEMDYYNIPLVIILDSFVD